MKQIQKKFKNDLPKQSLSFLFKTNVYLVIGTLLCILFHTLLMLLKLILNFNVETPITVLAFSLKKYDWNRIKMFSFQQKDQTILFLALKQCKIILNKLSNGLLKYYLISLLRPSLSQNSFEFLIDSYQFVKEQPVNDI